MSVFNPNGVAFPSDPEPEPAPAPAATCAPPPPEEDPAGGLLNFFKGGDPVHKCLGNPLLRGYVTRGVLTPRRALRSTRARR